MIDGRFIFSSRPWDSHEGNPADPQTVVGVKVTSRLCVNPSTQEALVALDDHRYSLTGQILAVGSKAQLLLHIRHRLLRPASDDHRIWLDQAMKMLEDA